MSRRKASAPFRGRHSTTAACPPSLHHPPLRSSYLAPASPSSSSTLPPLHKPAQPLWLCLWNKDDMLVFDHLHSGITQFPVQRLPFINQKHWTKIQEMKSNHMAVLETVTTSNLLLRVCSSFMFSKSIFMFLNTFVYFCSVLCVFLFASVFCSFSVFDLSGPP